MLISDLRDGWDLLKDLNEYASDAAGGKPEHLKEANKELTKGDKLALARKYVDASNRIVAYGEYAWKAVEDSNIVKNRRGSLNSAHSSCEIGG